jgi:hypothetical protein
MRTVYILQMEVGRHGLGGADAARLVDGVNNFVAVHVRAPNQEMADECALGNTQR